MNVQTYNRSRRGFTIPQPAPSDKHAFVEHLNDVRIHANILGIPSPYTEANADSWLAHRISELPETNETIFALRNEAGILIGTVDARIDLVPGVDHTSEIGYRLAARPIGARGS